uniref:30S ribosomal protein S6, chloroplastic n=2 Tax=Gelidium TaxID=2811 RepID=A0A411FT41_9FLOR|nr:ribosomal protein S6 [Gelidium coulteri]YP_009565310.1 ribosomal protein S6 [Gelidium sinicola]QBA96261.1 ribosomal protein S6 [Gelidium coulteri]QBA96661.1 ribosomal protein S6 [Gelidium sinicola]
MTLNNYETIYILKPDVNEDKNLSLVNEYKLLIKQSGGKNIFIQHRGRRNLKYNINHYYDGIYVQMNYEGNGEIIKIIEKSMKLNDQIIRYLTTRQDMLQGIKL